MTEVRFASTELVHMDRNTYMWVDLMHFSVDPGATDHQILTALMDAHEYHTMYIFGDGEFAEDPPVHASWAVKDLDTTMFRPTDAASAQGIILAWANWTEDERHYTQSRETMSRLNSEVLAYLRPGDVYEFHPPEGEEAMYGCGWILGQGGFHEFVVIDRDSSSLHVIVASDD
ncbi:hypothetical protein [Acidipropionibacterium virtanenii]|uniref:Uncharacterized protein n=1 Tax=Acidipropionibacterium virtanenii TaxID=2057246 RepID=A0A344UPU3_9ACTN|nr:hypothetical protein [Acidipropionibacterium virtanenii]AXE37291.1 hypothetical protein JS278_00094 [Acidipropionibacterium virtanenii]